MMKVSENDLWWAAGLLDGDGSVGVYNFKESQGTLTVSMGKAEKSLHILQKMQALFGGRVNRNKEAHDRYQAFYSWVITSHAAIAFCARIKNYVQLKKDQFETAALFPVEDGRGKAFKLINTDDGSILRFQSLEHLMKNKDFKLTIKQARSWINNNKYPSNLNDNKWRVELIQLRAEKTAIMNRLSYLKTVPHLAISAKLPPAYFSGGFDSEGCIRVQDLNGVSVSFPQKYRAICDSLKSQYGGGICYVDEKYNWTVSNREDAMRFINDILPFSIEKKPQLELVKNMPVNGAPQVAKELRKYKGNQGKEPIEKELRKPKKRLHGLPQYITELKRNNVVIGYIVTYKGSIRKFGSSDQDLETKLQRAKDSLTELKQVEQSKSVVMPDLGELPKYISYKRLKGMIIGLRVNHKKGQAHFSGGDKTMEEHLNDATTFLQTLLTNST